MQFSRFDLSVSFGPWASFLVPCAGTAPILLKPLIVAGYTSRAAWFLGLFRVCPLGGLLSVLQSTALTFLLSPANGHCRQSGYIVSGFGWEGWYSSPLGLGMVPFGRLWRPGGISLELTGCHFQVVERDIRLSAIVSFSERWFL